MIQREERKERRERKETRITRDVRTFVGWGYIRKIVKLCSFPELVMAIFLTGGRATEVLELLKGHFAEFDTHYDVVGMPVFKRFDIIRKYIDPEGQRRWDTELRMERRTFPILKTTPFSTELWEYTQSCEDKLFDFPGYKDQYWQVYTRIHQIEAPENPYAPKTLYPHWLRGQRAAQLRIEYGLDIDQLMKFFGWKSFKTAQHYAGMSSRDLVKAMMEGKTKEPYIPPPPAPKRETTKISPKRIKIEKPKKEKFDWREAAEEVIGSE